ncbi:RNA polymerase sigma factor [Pedobacter metabolipauper]|uniref:RNA polymerase sigma-70 factor (ECF subfamily) n=1 Tax=Pedobacter metabolipauper TaxID=425513 RepID=A0A4R6SRW8_9SPHI|nr:sigma-70 family RNA polymerase sigma factor [Pedobacter metabolipauper]TDQ08105.1 RNA polymerase sigma-70 factor (ECF subfamily) [Pedobacter metabolipauper]
MAYVPLINENELLQRLRNNDEQAFETLYSHYVDPIYRKLLYLVKSADIAEELTQDVFLKIWEKRDTINQEKSFRAFVYSIALNLTRDMYRRIALDKKLQDHLINSVTELHYPIDAYYEEEANRRLILDAIDTLPLQRKKVMTLVKLEGKSYEEVNELLGISTSTVRDHVVKGTKTIKIYLTNNKSVTVIVLAAAISDTFTNNFF